LQPVSGTESRRFSGIDPTAAGADGLERAFQHGREILQQIIFARIYFA